MDKDIHPYKQKGMTCAIACMLMVLEYNQIIPKANWIYERKYFNSYRSRYMDGTPFSALAWHMAKNGLDVEIMHSEKDLFNNSQQYISENVFENALNEYSDFLDNAKSVGAKVIKGCKIDASVLRKQLTEDKLVVLAGYSGTYLHAILLCGWDNNQFVVCDPLYSKKQAKSIEEINSFMDTPLGKWCIAIKSKIYN